MTAEEMREAAAAICDRLSDEAEWRGSLVAEAAAAAIRALPIPPDPVREELLAVVRAMATFDGRNNNAALKEMARAAIAKAEAKP